MLESPQHQHDDETLEILADNASHILVVDDDMRLRDLLTRFLIDQGYRVSSASHTLEADRHQTMLCFDAIVLDVMMPGENGFDYARRLRATSDIPILMLTARAQSDDRITGLEIGVDDYLPKPFEPRELVLRLANILKRVSVPVPIVNDIIPDDQISFGDFTFRITKGELKKAGERVRLSERELHMLTLLAQSEGGQVSRDALAGVDDGGNNERTIDVQMNRLRRKIEPDPANPLYIQTVRGVGYRLVIS